MKTLFILAATLTGLTGFLVEVQSAEFSSLPENCWARICASPGDPGGRDVPPGRGATWVWEPNTQKFLRYGGYTPGYSNAMEAFDPAAETWTRLYPFDETYPSTRPGGGANWMLSYDSVRKVVWMACGWTNRSLATGDQGVWKYDPVADTFIRTGNGLGYNTYVIHDPVNDVLVATPPAAYDASRITDVFNLKTGVWQRKSVTACPQTTWGGYHPGVFDSRTNRVTVVTGDRIWTYDAAANRWDSLVVAPAPVGRRNPALGYDPVRQAVIFYGGSDGREQPSLKNDTWVFSSVSQTWAQITTQGFPLTLPIFYHQAFKYYPPAQCMLLNDPDLGVWAFKYNPATAAGVSLVDYDTVIAGKAAKNPAAPGPADVLLTFPSPLNQKLLDLPDNTLYRFSKGCNSGEVGWEYDPDAGIIARYGGCGNGNSVYWTGYGNNLDIFDPGREIWISRRVCDVSGTLRVWGGCTRSTFYDTRRKRWWFFGKVSGVPYCDGGRSVGPWNYDVATDLFENLNVPASAPEVQPYTRCTYDPDHDITVYSTGGKTYIYHFDTRSWETLTTAGGPRDCGGYHKVVYVASIRKYLQMDCSDTGTPGRLKTLLFDPATKSWADAAPAVSPTYRGTKFGLAYDSRNDAVILVGGQLTWGGTSFSDIWAYDVKANSWRNMSPAAVSGGLPGNSTMMTAYDSRHNVIITVNQDGQSVWAYRYKKTSSGSEADQAGPSRPVLSVAPNPFSGRVRIELYGQGATRLTILDLQGRQVASWRLSASNEGSIQEWTARDCPNGLYLVRATGPGARVFTTRLVIQR